MSTVVEEHRGPVLVITLNRPHKRNAIDPNTTEALDAALDRLAEDRRLRVAVLHGAGGAFSAGTDLVHGSGQATENGGEYGIAQRRLVKPLIAAVEGPAVGGGFEIALACHLVVAGTSAHFALPEAQRGLVASAGGLFRARQSLPRNLATEMLIAGGSLTAERAAQLGLVNRLVADGQALAGALELADQVCRSSPVAVAAALEALDAQDEEGNRRGWRATEIAQAAVLDSPEHDEGVAAFLERRDPRW